MDVSSSEILPLRLYSAKQVRAIDQSIMAQEAISAFDLMTRAAQAALNLLLTHYPATKQLCVFAGSGNNGGDAWLLAALALKQGLKVEFYFLAEQGMRSQEGQAAQAYALAAGVEPQPFVDELTAKADLIVDGLLGTGLEGEVTANYQTAINAINQSAAAVFSLDIPSGLSADTGAILGAAVKADLTLTFVALKQGLMTAEGPDSVGKLCYASLTELSIDQLSAEIGVERIVWQHLPQSRLLAARPKNSHKGMFGHVLVVGGELGYGGAAILASEAASRCGAGLVTCATRSEHLSALLVRCPNVMTKGIESGLELQSLIKQANVIAIGPGLGRQGWGELLLQQALLTTVPLIMDADALNLLALPNWQKSFTKRPAVLTPHPAEAARLLGSGVTVAEVQADRFNSAITLAKKYSAVIVLKGQGTIVASPDGRMALCTGGNAGMSSGGMGDVLTGVIAALVAQGLDVWAASCLGVSLHAQAADSCAQEQGALGMLAQDLIPYLQKHINR